MNIQRIRAIKNLRRFNNAIYKMSYVHYIKIGICGAVTENHELQLFASIVLFIFIKSD